MTAHPRYRLVIGASQFANDPDKWNLSAVEPTVALIDARLKSLGFDALPSRRLHKLPYITGPEATLSEIKSALVEMTQSTVSGGYGIVYYAGHGTLSPNRNDVVLSVYDRPVTDTDGLRVTDLIGELTVGKWQYGSMLGIGNFLVVLDACNTGGAVKNVEGVLTIDSIQRVVTSQSPTIPQRIALITAASDGQLAYSLKNIPLTAFGAYFALALKEDWTCADDNTDGVITAGELKDYIAARLADTVTANGLAAVMRPQGANIQDALAVYNPSNYRRVGERKALDIIQVSADSAAVNSARPTEVAFSNGVTVPCSGGCRIPIPTDFSGTLEVHADARQIVASQTTGETSQPLGCGGQGIFRDILCRLGSVGSFGGIHTQQQQPPKSSPAVVRVALDALRANENIRSSGVVVSLTKTINSDSKQH